MRTRFSTSMATLLIMAVAAIASLANHVEYAIHDELISDPILATTRGTGKNDVVVQKNASCADNDLHEKNLTGVTWDKCTAEQVPAGGNASDCYKCADETTQGTISDATEDSLGNYTPNTNNPTACNNRRKGVCGVSPTDPNAYTCQFDNADGQCGTLPQNGEFQESLDGGPVGIGG